MQSFSYFFPPVNPSLNFVSVNNKKKIYYTIFCNNLKNLLNSVTWYCFLWVNIFVSIPSIFVVNVCNANGTCFLESLMVCKMQLKHYESPFIWFTLNSFHNRMSFHILLERLLMLFYVIHEKWNMNKSENRGNP